LGAIVGCYFAAACGETTKDLESPHASAGSGSGGSAGSGAVGGSAGVGSGQNVAGTAGFAGVAPRGGVSEPPRHPLIIGDDACPAAAPQVGACNVDASCVYSGISVGLAETLSPMACTCAHGNWSCVSSDEKGVIVCPLEQPPSDPASMRVEGPCPPKAALPCTYTFYRGPALAVCYSCQETADTQGGAGGDAGVTSTWVCGL
jgi:hypothetical protein